MSEARFHEIRWYWVSNDSDLRVGYAGMDGRVSLAELLAYLAEVAPGVAPEDIDINYATVKWTRPPTEEELAERAERQAHHDRRHEKWEREALVRLLDKYGDPR